MNRLILTIGLALTAALVHAETLTNCVRTGNTVNCTTQSREAANTPPSYRRLGGKEWCLVSNAPIKKYFCGYDSFDGCMVAANIDNLYGPVSSCIKNSGYRSPSSQEVSGVANGGNDPVKAGWVALKNGDYQTAAQIFLANEHNPQAQMALGLMYAGGQGVTKNLEQARTWLLRAKRNGVIEADDGLKLVENEIATTSLQQTLSTIPISKPKLNEESLCKTSSECSGDLVCLHEKCQRRGNQCRNNSECPNSGMCRWGYCLTQ